MDRELFRTVWNHFYNDNKEMLDTMEDSDMCFAFLEWLEKHKSIALLRYHGYFHKINTKQTRTSSDNMIK